jgi:hypothetical protein
MTQFGVERATRGRAHILAAEYMRQLSRHASHAVPASSSSSLDMIGPPGRWSAPSITEPEETAVDVGSWLRNLGLERYETAFRENEVGVEDLCHLTAEDLEGIGVAAIGHRRRLVVAIAKLSGLKERAAATTLYLMPADHRRLRKLAIDRDTSMQTLILDALDLLLARENEPPVERWETRRKK